MPRAASRLRVLLVDPRGTRLSLLRDLLEKRKGRLEVLTDLPSTVEEAFDALVHLRPSIALIDSDGALDVLELAERVMAQQPTPMLVMVAPPGDPDLAASWIAAGVLDTIARPTPSASPAEREHFGEDLLQHLELLAGVRVVRHIRSRSTLTQALPWVSPRYLGIVASTGGPPAVSAILRALGPNPRAAVLIVQHIGQQFSESLAEWFRREAPLPLRLARDGEAPAAGRAYLAPANADLTLESGRLRVRPTADRRHAPGDALLASLAAEAPASSVGVVLTGIGADGSEGLLALRRGGGLTLAQDRDSSAVWGMPQVCAATGAASEVLSLTEIAARLAGLFAAGRAAQQVHL